MKRLSPPRYTPLDRLHVCVTGTRPAYFAHLCAQNRVRMRRLRAVDGGFTAFVPAAEYKRMHPWARAGRVRVHILRKYGPSFALRRYRTRFGLAVGCLLFSLFIFFASRWVWSVQFVQIPANAQQAILQQLWQNGLYTGAVVSQQKLQSAENALLQQSERFGWISLNFLAGRLVVEQIPAEHAPEQPAAYSCPLIACTEAQILATDVKSGFLIRPVGQTVAKGDVLISTSQLDRSGNAIIRPAMGSVTGLVQKTYQCTQPREVQQSALTGKTKTLVDILGPGGLELIQKGRDPTQTGFEKAGVRVEPMELFGFSLPATAVRTLYVQRAVQTISLSDTAAESFARYACLRQLYTEFPDACPQKIEWQIEAAQQDVTATMTVLFSANIAVPAE